MIFIETKLKGSFTIEIEKLEDERGFFARTWDRKIFEEKVSNPNLAQCNISFNKLKGTLRGMHYQKEPYQEAKLVRCTKGRIYDVVIDLRPKSQTFKEWFGVELSEDNHAMHYVPEGFAHGFQTLEDNSEVFYQISEFYKPEYSAGIRWDDKAFQITWPLKPTQISKRDLSYEQFE